MFDESTKLCDVKYKIVFLGSSAVGKSAIIERFIQERFDANKNVDFVLARKQWESIFLLRMSHTKEQPINFSFGILQGNKNSKA
jgi:GTPase SAR1 family protein